MRTSTYGQFCPVAKAAEMLTERWTPLILRELLAGSHRFNDLRRGVPLMSPSLLSSRLRQLEHSGIVLRTRSEEGRWEYHLTESGQACRPLINQMGAWGQRWALARITREDLDPALVMWFLRRKAQSFAARLPAHRVVVLFDLMGGGPGKRYWWLVLDRPSVDLCLSDPGFGTDLTLRSDVRTMAMIVLGEIAIEGARRARGIAVEGPARLRRSLAAWLGLAQPA